MTGQVRADPLARASFTAQAKLSPQASPPLDRRRSLAGVLCDARYDNQTTIAAAPADDRGGIRRSTPSRATTGSSPRWAAPAPTNGPARSSARFVTSKRSKKDFPRGSHVPDDLRARVPQSIETVADVRVDGTSRRRVDEAYDPAPVDAYHPAPGVRPGDTLSVHIDPHRARAFDAAGALVATHSGRDPSTALDERLIGTIDPRSRAGYWKG